MTITIVLMWMAYKMQAPIWIWLILGASMAYNILVWINALLNTIKQRTEKEYQKRIKDLYPHDGEDK